MPTIAVQNFNGLSPDFTFTDDALPSGSFLTNAGSFASGGPDLGFRTIWYQTRANELGPVDGEESGDFIGVNGFGGSNAPDVAPDGTMVGAGEHNYEFNDGDGNLVLSFDALDLSGYTNRSMSVSYWIADTGYEADDSFEIGVSDGTNFFSFMTLSEAELESQAAVDSGSASEWNTVTFDLDDAIEAGLDPSALQVQVSVDTNSGSENIFIDDVRVDADEAAPGAPQIVISEVMFNPASSEDDWEWIEIHNAGPTAVDLSGWVVDDINSVSHESANIASGSIAPGETAILYNADDVSAAEFEAAWGTGINLVAVTNWSAMALNNGGDTIGLWTSFADYENDHDVQANALVSVAYDGSIDDGAGSVYLTDLEDQQSFDLSAEGLGTPAGDTYMSAPEGGNSGSDVGSPGGTFDDTPPPSEIARIHEVQGSGAASTRVGQTVTVSAIVTGDFQNGDADMSRTLNGFFLQEEDADADGDAMTSEGIFVFDGESPSVDVEIGDLVEVTGTVTEYFGETQLTDVTVNVISSGNALPTAASVALPASETTLSQGGSVQPDLEAYEGMRVSFADTLTISEMFQLDRFNEIKLVEGERPEQFTQSNRPDADGYQQHLQELGARTITYDDGLNVQNAAIDNLDGFQGFDDASGLSMGDTIDNLTGVLSYQWAGNSASGATWRVRATEDGENTFEDTNPREEAPSDVGSDFTVASLNVLNYFTTIDDGSDSGENGSGPSGTMEPRGADDLTSFSGLPPASTDALAEFQRQTDKLVTAMLDIGADIFGLIELENEFFDQNGDGLFSIGYLVDALNDAIGSLTYSWVQPGTPFVGTDAIAQGFIYDVTTTATIGDAAILDDIDFLDPVNGNDPENRPAVAQTFEEIASGEALTIAVNHFKSKGSAVPNDPDTGDGQANGSETRKLAAEKLADWLETDPTGSGDEDFMIIGDLNAYAMEDPLLALQAAGYTNLAETFEPGGYSYVFDGQVGTLDYALANSSLLSQVTGATEWHINSDEADALDYNLDFGRPPSYFDGSTPYRASDHDPIIVGLDLQSDPAPEVFTLELLHVTDQEPLQAGGGFSNIKNASGIINAFRAEDLGGDGIADNTLLLSSGDAVIPGLFYSASEAVFGASGIADIQIQNELGVQAIALGNHEFDDGPAVLASLIDGSAGEGFDHDDDPSTPDVPNFYALVGTDLEGMDFDGSDFPYLSSNLDFSTQADLAALAIAGGQAPQANVVTSSTVLETNGERIGVVGATTPTLASISSPGGVGISPSPFGSDPTPEQIAALAAEIQTEVDALLAADPEMNKVILLAHMQSIAIEYELAALLENVDVIVAGGSNTRLFDENDVPLPGDSDQGGYPQFVTNAGGTTTAVVNTDGSYKYVGRLVLDFDADGNIIPASYDADMSGAFGTDEAGLQRVSELTGQDAAALIDPEIGAIVDAIEQQIIETEGNVFGVSEVFLNGNRSGSELDGVRTQETNLGNLTADANLAYAKAYESDIVISIKNGGGIRASIGETVVLPGETEASRLPNSEVVDGGGDTVKPAGGISENDIKTTLAFNNGLVAMTLTKQEIVDLLEHGVSAVPGVSGRFPQIAGLEFSYDPDLPAGERILSAEIVDEDGNMIAPLVFDGEIVGSGADTYRIVTLDFLSAPSFDSDGNFIGAGDGYPFPNTNTDPAVGEVGDPDVIARVNRVEFEESEVQMGDATFAPDGSEQDALAEYLNANFNPATGGEAYDVADTPRELDGRIQNLDYRDDDVFEFDELFVGDGSVAQRFELTEGVDLLYLAEDLSNGVRQRFLVNGFEAGDMPGFDETDVALSRSTGPNLLVYLDNDDRDSFVFYGVDSLDVLFQAEDALLV